MSIRAAPAWVYRIGIALFLLQIADAWTTLYLTHSQGIDLEANPIIRWVLLKSPLLFVGLKMAMGAFCAWWPPYMYEKTWNYPKTQWFLKLSLWALTAEYTLVVASNAVGVVLALLGYQLAPR